MSYDFLAGGAADNCVYEGNVQQSEVSETGEIIVPIGTKADGELVFQDISQIPHFLVCGLSGTGKTSFVQTVIAYLAAHYSPEKVGFLVYDSKILDYGGFNSLSHLISPVLTDEKITKALSWLPLEREKRFKLLSDASAKNIASYNEQCAVTGNETLAHLFVILDDFSSIPLDEDTIVPLMDVLKNGRPVGIHLIFVTSLISSKFFPKDILSNVPCRVSFCVSTKADSKVAIEQTGAEHLSIPGELIFRWQGSLIKCQGAYMPDEDIKRVVKRLQHQRKRSVNALGDMAAQIFEASTEQSEKASDTLLAGDEMLPAAVDVILETGQASVSMIQHRLKLGYARAARIIDEMEERGIVGPFQGSKPRDILITKSQWRAMRYENEKYSQSYTSAAKSPSASQSYTISNPTADDDEAPDIEMRDFAQFNSGKIGLCVTDNLIRITNKAMTKYGPGTTTAIFNGKSVARLIYKKPHAFSAGYIEFVLKPKVEINNQNPELITITKDKLSNILRIKFGNNISHIMKVFMVQISQDIGIPLSEL